MIDNDWRGLDMRELNDSKRLETFHLYAQGRIESKRRSDLCFNVVCAL